jgi:hypothetical protein
MTANHGFRDLPRCAGAAAPAAHAAAWDQALTQGRSAIRLAGLWVPDGLMVMPDPGPPLKGRE